MTVAVIADIVGSRLLADRQEAQRLIEDAVRRAHDAAPVAVRPLTPTVGDELQGIYPSLDEALAGILLIRLASPPDGVDCRFGIGVGEVGVIASTTVGAIAEGPGWWAAREAIDTVHALQRRTVPGARTWVAAPADAPDDTRAAVRIANAGVLARDHLITAMGDRARRIAYGRCLGRTQRELADAEGITQSAVSQLLASTGGSALVEGYRALRRLD
jgi:hypothetical protein